MSSTVGTVLKRFSFTTAFFAAFFACNLAFSAEPGTVPFRNLNSLIHQLGLRPYYSLQPGSRRIKIAILDNGFAGYATELGRTLPSDTLLHAGPVPAPQPEEVHGLVMAQLVQALMTDGGAQPKFTPELHLYNTYGYSNFKAAVEDIISIKADLVLYSQVWEYGGNNDGKGFINHLVSQATDAGILWINAAGNFGATTFNSAIVDGPDHWIRLPDPNQSIAVRCQENPSGGCHLRLVLSWNDFKDDVNVGTDKDLDLVLSDDTLNIIQTSGLAQVPSPVNRPGTSLYPREIIVTDLSPGLYYIRVKNRSLNFGTGDRLRITASGDFIQLSHTDSAESLLNPADHPDTLTVGASDSDRSSLSRSLGKPEWTTPSLIQLSETESFKGSSNSAAMVVAALGVVKSLHPALTRERALQLISDRGIWGHPGNGLPLEALGFSPTGPGCFIPIDPRSVNAPTYVWNALSYGGILVATSAGYKIMYDFDPIRLMPGIRRNLPTDILVIGPAGTGLYPRSMLYRLPPALVEVLELPTGQVICGTSPVNGSVEFRLPSPSRW